MELIQPTLKSSVVFLIFVADVAPMINNFISLYADDSKLFNYMYDTTDELIQEDINILSRWADDMQMSFNVDKCHTLHLGTRNKNQTFFLPKMSKFKKSPNSISYTLTLHPLENVKEEKDLGVIVDQNLNFKSHISSEISK